MRWEGHVSPMEEIKNAYKILFGIPEWENTAWRTHALIEG
jgi:hypothetical protein